MNFSAGWNQINEALEKVGQGGELTFAEALALSKVSEEDLPLLLAAANRLREEFVGNEVDLCSIVNGRSGRCPENCAFCAQSAHYETKIDIYSLKTPEELLASAKEAEAGGALRFSIVTSGRGTDKDKEFAKIIEAFKLIKRETKLKICASLGLLTLEHAKALVEAGVERYHHNIETARSFYPEICTTHDFDARAKTIENAHKAGMEVCSGGIIGLGETMEQRLEMAFELKKLQVHSVPINILNPIPGTPLAKQPGLSPREILRTFALFRFILPKQGIRTAGGREVNLRDLQGLALFSGISGMLIGGYLTTGGRAYEDDLKMVQDLGLVPLSARD